MDISTIITMVTGGILSISGGAITSWWEGKRERRQQIWKKEIDRIIDLEERAGILTEMICGHQILAQELITATSKQFEEIKWDAGKFRRHKNLSQSIIDLYMLLGAVSVMKINHNPKKAQELSTEAYEQLDKLMAECDKITGKRSI